jgi:hypothetical protein
MKSLSKALFALPAAVLVTTLASLPSQASTLNATRVESYREGGGITEAFRRNTNNALGVAQAGETRDFLSLGLGGEAIFSFGGLFTGTVTLWETTWGNHTRQSAHDERVRVFVGNSLESNAQWTEIGQIFNIADDADGRNGASLNAGSGAYRFLRVVDISPTTGANATSGDGFDINAISVQEARSTGAPEPTTMAGLAIAGAGAIAARRKAKQSAKV